MDANEKIINIYYYPEGYLGEMVVLTNFGHLFVRTKNNPGEGFTWSKIELPTQLNG